MFQKSYSVEEKKKKKLKPGMARYVVVGLSLCEKFQGKRGLDVNQKEVKFKAS